MLSPSTLALARQAPPVRPSRSLEGLEQVIPPRVPQSPARPTPHLDKPLPDLPAHSKPLPDTPSMDEGSAAWSDDSSTLSSIYDRRFSCDSTESYPVFVRSGSDDLTELADHPPAPAPADPYGAEPKSTPLPITATFLHDDSSERPPAWTAPRAGPNHYFREKKWDFFPELADPSAVPSSPRFPTQPPKKNNSRLNLAVFDFSKGRNRWHSSDKGGRAIAHDVRDSIRSYVQRRLSKNSMEKDRPHQTSRPATDPPEYVRKPTPTPTTPRTTPSKELSDAESPRPLLTPQTASPSGKRLSRMSTRSTVGPRGKRPRSVAFQRTKQPAVPMSPYQKYGSALWENPGREKRISYRQNHRVRFPRYRKKGTSSKKGFVSSATPPLTPPARSQLQQNTRDCVRALQDSTYHLLGALDGARKKMIGTRVDRRHTELKSQIRLVGPVSPYNNNYGQSDPWI
ncbi:hypothetical protein BO70DRAFT_357872 [Aspergillus heteromorphus CBS 117.55]|uniref:Uncharacterized protein n=1 Tax=Aspergillus heteromorphus CBS 117.55 TaxID=1448321 RepID=A0A317X3K1_9EURO|nr:uncharacterized protein BO70DRAFT_357872 [Aspergillus heteromorphus CBS 117.55]PWY92731.1 hypothetical protein BO70DRAFT_357872 [Aspergillus heteromorphus CBS 117.55]